MNHDSIGAVDELPLEEGSDQVDMLPPVHTKLIVLDSPHVNAGSDLKGPSA